MDASNANIYFSTQTDPVRHLSVVRQMVAMVEDKVAAVAILTMAMSLSYVLKHELCGELKEFTAPAVNR